MKIFPCKTMQNIKGIVSRDVFELNINDLPILFCFTYIYEAYIGENLKFKPSSFRNIKI